MSETEPPVGPNQNDLDNADRHYVPQSETTPIGCDSLDKAQDDDFDYLMQLRTGQMIEFGSAKRSPDGVWVHLERARLTALNFSSLSARGKEVRVVHDPYFPHALYDGPEFSRGVDVRISDIVWCSDCPGGS